MPTRPWKCDGNVYRHEHIMFSCDFTLHCNSWKELEDVGAQLEEWSTSNSFCPTTIHSCIKLYVVNLQTHVHANSETITATYTPFSTCIHLHWPHATMHGVPAWYGCGTACVKRAFTLCTLQCIHVHNHAEAVTIKTELNASYAYACKPINQLPVIYLDKIFYIDGS